MRDAPLLFGLSAVTLMLVLAALFLGAQPLAPGEVLAGLLGAGDAGLRIIVWEIRMPRALAALAVGATLGVTGAALQGLLRNPLADPGVLGVSATAALFVTVVLYWGIATTVQWAPPLAAVAGAMLATALLSFAAARTASVVSLILIGVGLSSFAGAAMALLMNFAPNPFSLSEMVNWMLGSVANRSLADLALAAPFIGLGLALVWIGRGGLRALSLGEEAALGIGLDLTRARLLIVAGTGLAVGGAVSLAGAIGFVGLVAPHIVRPFVDHDAARTLAPAGLLAGALVVASDVIVRLAPSDTELKLGVVAALIGAPVFIWIAAQRRGDHG